MGRCQGELPATRRPWVDVCVSLNWPGWKDFLPICAKKRRCIWGEAVESGEHEQKNTLAGIRIQPNWPDDVNRFALPAGRWPVYVRSMDSIQKRVTTSD